MKLPSEPRLIDTLSPRLGSRDSGRSSIWFQTAAVGEREDIAAVAIVARSGQHALDLLDGIGVLVAERCQGRGPRSRTASVASWSPPRGRTRPVPCGRRRCRRARFRGRSRRGARPDGDRAAGQQPLDLRRDARLGRGLAAAGSACQGAAKQDDRAKVMRISPVRQGVDPRLCAPATASRATVADMRHGAQNALQNPLARCVPFLASFKPPLCAA